MYPCLFPCSTSMKFRKSVVCHTAPSFGPWIGNNSDVLFNVTVFCSFGVQSVEGKWICKNKKKSFTKLEKKKLKKKTMPNQTRKFRVGFCICGFLHTLVGLFGNNSDLLFNVTVFCSFSVQVEGMWICNNNKKLYYYEAAQLARPKDRKKDECIIKTNITNKFLVFDFFVKQNLYFGLIWTFWAVYSS